MGTMWGWGEGGWGTGAGGSTVADCVSNAETVRRSASRFEAGYHHAHGTEILDEADAIAAATRRVFRQPRPDL